MPYEQAVVCLSGHFVNRRGETHPEKNDQFCARGGEQAIAACPHCRSAIRGCYQGSGPGEFGFSPSDPASHCHACGKPYPWTQRRAEAIQEMLDELDGLTDEEREKLRKSVPDIIADTPRSETAALRFKKAVAKVGQAGGKMLMNVLTSVATQAVKKSMGL